MEVLTVPQCPWQNPYAEGLIGSIRRDCLRDPQRETSQANSAFLFRLLPRVEDLFRTRQAIQVACQLLITESKPDIIWPGPHFHTTFTGYFAICGSGVTSAN